jgi:hypothetical protein
MSMQVFHCLDNTQLRRRDIQRIHIRRQPRIRFLAPIRPYQRVDLHTLHIIQRLNRLLDLSLIRLDIHDEHERVVLLDLLHRRFGVERVHDDLVVVESGCVRDGFAWVFGCSL